MTESTAFKTWAPSPESARSSLARLNFCTECHQRIYQAIDSLNKPMGLWYHMENSSLTCPYVVQL